MTALFATLAPWKKLVDIGLVVALLAGALWIYLALVHRSEQITTLKAANGQLSKAAADDAAAVIATKAQLQRTTDALTASAAEAIADAATEGKLKERISHAGKDGCLGPAERALLDGLRNGSIGAGSPNPPAGSP